MTEASASPGKNGAYDLQRGAAGCRHIVTRVKMWPSLLCERCAEDGDTSHVFEVKRRHLIKKHTRRKPWDEKKTWLQEVCCILEPIWGVIWCKWIIWRCVNMKVFLRIIERRRICFDLSVMLSSPTSINHKAFGCMQAPLASGLGVISDESVCKENKFLTPRGLGWPFNHRKWRQVGYSHTQTHTMVLTSPSTCLISSLTNPQTHTMCAKTFLFLRGAIIVFKRVKSPWNVTLCAD